MSSTHATTSAPSLTTHVDALRNALGTLDIEKVQHLGERLAAVLRHGGRLLVAGNGGSASHAQHLTAEMVGRYRLADRCPYSAIALHAESSTVTAIANDFGWDDVFARQVRAHGRPGDILLLISTSGRSTNLLRAATVGRQLLLEVWALTGAEPNRLAASTDDVIAVDAASTATVQEVHQLVVHLLCEVVDDQSQTSEMNAT
jgi:phosphoheptose isomerase